MTIIKKEWREYICHVRTPLLATWEAGEGNRGATIIGIGFYFYLQFVRQIICYVWNGVS
jgi:hypothetical protein